MHHRIRQFSITWMEMFQECPGVGLWRPSRNGDHNSLLLHGQWLQKTQGWLWVSKAQSGHLDWSCDDQMVDCRYPSRQVIHFGSYEIEDTVPLNRSFLVVLVMASSKSNCCNLVLQPTPHYSHMGLGQKKISTLAQLCLISYTYYVSKS